MWWAAVRREGGSQPHTPHVQLGTSVACASAARAHSLLARPRAFQHQFLSSWTVSRPRWWSFPPQAASEHTAVCPPLSAKAAFFPSSTVPPAQGTVSPLSLRAKASSHAWFRSYSFHCAHTPTDTHTHAHTPGGGLAQPVSAFLLPSTHPFLSGFFFQMDSV